MTDLPADLSASAHLGPAYQWLHAFALGEERPWRTAEEAAREREEIDRAIADGADDIEAIEACHAKRPQGPAFDLAEEVAEYADNARPPKPESFIAGRIKAGRRWYPHPPASDLPRHVEHAAFQRQELREMAAAAVVAALKAPEAADAIARVSVAALSAGDTCHRGVSPLWHYLAIIGLHRHFERRKGGEKKLGKSAATASQREKFLDELAAISTRQPGLSYSRRVVKAIRRSGFPLSDRRARDIGRKAGFS